MSTLISSEDTSEAGDGCVVWITGLPAAGKSTLAKAFAQRLRAQHRAVIGIDGDLLRDGLCSDLGFSARDRTENIRRAAEIARVVADAGLVCVAALISPLSSHRALARSIVGPARFVEVFVATPAAVCRLRDGKGNYARADRGEIPEFTGVSAPYEVPENPDVVVRADAEAVSSSVERVLTCLAIVRYNASPPRVRHRLPPDRLEEKG